MIDYKKLIKEYFKDKSFIQSNIESFNNFMDNELQKIINETEDIIPTIIPEEAESFKIKFSKVNIKKPEVIEADGSRRKLYPMEARLRALTYAASVEVEVSVYINNIQRESFTIEIGKIPIMIKSKYCNLYNLKSEELLEHDEDSNDFGGYFILNGNERVLIIIEDLVSNKLFIAKEDSGPQTYTAKIYSERSSYRVPHTLEQTKDGLITLSFTRFRRVPIVSVIKALGLVKDQEIVQAISKEKQYDSVFINLVECVDLKTEEDAVDFLAKKIGITQEREQKMERTRDQLDRYLLPHLGIEPKDRLIKALNICKLVRQFLTISEGKHDIEDKDHFSNKRLKLSGDLLGDLFRVNMRNLVQDILYNFQRLVKRGKFQSIRIIIRNELITSRIKSAMATGTWVGGRKGVSQNVDRTNALSTLSHLQRVVSLLESTQENFEARALHGTHFGRLCAIETPEGTPIGLRKNLALLCSVTKDENVSDKIKKSLVSLGMKE
ncbi:DNA-directed RNA polymerase subunit B'' [Candidatus Woesearchaeota archaeon]|nr:DNA-directed RNA polymerase subunit B'' [Candidatus Woesearchaeota archaeon]